MEWGIHPREVGGEMFFAAGPGRHDDLMTATEYRAHQAREIEQHQVKLATLREQETALIRRLESALIDLTEPAAPIRVELSSVRIHVRQVQDTIDQIQAAIQSVIRLSDEHVAGQIAQADRARIDALTQPFDHILENAA